MTSVFDRPCTTVTSLVTSYLERALSPVQQLTFETHLVYCSGCSTFLRQVADVADALRELPPDDVPAHERELLVETFGSGP